MNVLVVDVGGTHVKVLASGEKRVSPLDSDLRWFRNAVVAQPGRLPTLEYTWCRSAIRDLLLRNRPRRGAAQFGTRLGRFQFLKLRSAHPVKLINDAAMQALGSYNGGEDAFPRPGNRSRIRL